MALRRVVVGNNYLLLHMEGIHAKHQFSSEAMANSFLVAYIKTYGRFLSIACILTIYDAMLVAQRNGRPYQPATRTTLTTGHALGGLLSLLSCFTLANIDVHENNCD